MSNKVVIIKAARSEFMMHPDADRLVLTHRGITRLPENIGELKDLTHLDLSENELTSLPESIGNLKKLETLILAENKLTTLPESIRNLKKLEFLHLSDLKLTKVPLWIGDLTSLIDLDFDHTEVGNIPEIVGNLKKLKELRLDGTKMTRLPESIEELENLTLLSVRYNKLTELPENIGKLKNLKELRLDDNPIKKIPKSFKNLPDNLRITYNDDRSYSKRQFMKLFIKQRISNNTELFNNAISKTNRISNIPVNKRVYIHKNSNVKNNGTLRRVYHKNGINGYMRGRTQGRLHGNVFTKQNVEPVSKEIIVNRSVYLKNIKNRLRNTSLNNFNSTANKIKSNLPSNVSRTDVNNVISSLKPERMSKIFNKLKNSPQNNRLRILNDMKKKGVMNQSDVDAMKKKLMKLNFIRNSKKSPPKTIRTGLNSNIVRKSPYI